MLTTALHHKPIVYGSDLADGAFFVLVLLHAIAGVVAPVAAAIAFATTKGARRHVRAGSVFVRAMTVVALSGIGADVVRLVVYVTENHTKYADAAMPSTYPARLASCTSPCACSG